MSSKTFITHISGSCCFFSHLFPFSFNFFSSFHYIHMLREPVSVESILFMFHSNARCHRAIKVMGKKENKERHLIVGFASIHRYQLSRRCDRSLTRLLYIHCPCVFQALCVWLLPPLTVCTLGTRERVAASKLFSHPPPSFFKHQKARELLCGFCVCVGISRCSQLTWCDFMENLFLLG